MRKFLSILVAVVMLMSMVPVFGAGTPVAKADASAAIVEILMPATGETYTVNEKFYVNAAISNPTDSAMSGNAVIDPGLTAALVTGEVASKPVTVPAHGVVDVWWQLKCVSGGDSTITVTFNGVSDSVLVHQYSPPTTKLKVEIIEPEGDLTLPISSDFVVKAKVTAPLQDVSNVSVTITFDNDLVELTNGDPQTWNLGYIYKGDTHTVAWNLHCKGAGKTTVKVSATGDGVLPTEVVNDSFKLTQGEVEEGPGPFNVTLDAYEKVCTNCGELNTFFVTANIANDTEHDVLDAHAVISIVSGSSTANFIDTGTYPLDKDLLTIGDGDSAQAQWHVLCHAEGDVVFKVVASGYIDINDNGTKDADDQYVEDIDTRTVQQRALITDITEAWTDSNPHVTDPVLATEGLQATVCDDVYVKAVIKNCTCIPYDHLTVSIFANDDVIPIDSDVEFAPKDLNVYVEQFDKEGFVQSYTVPINSENPNGDVPLTSLCDCCEYRITWHLHCKGESTDTIKVATFKQDGSVLDFDSFTLEQGTPPALTKVIEFFPGWYSDKTLEITPGSGIIPREEYAVSQNWTAVIVVTNIGGRKAADVRLTLGADGGFDPAIGGTLEHATLVYMDGDVTPPKDLKFEGDYLASFFFDGIEKGESKKIIIEGHCSGDPNVTFYVQGDTVIYDPASKLVGGESLSIDALIKFYDEDASGSWDAGEPVVYDKDNDGKVSTGDIPISGTLPPNDTVLSPDLVINFVDIPGGTGGVWDAGEPVVYDEDENGTYNKSGLTGKDPLTDKPILASLTYNVPNSDTIKQIPLEINFINPADGAHFQMSTKFAVKVEIKNKSSEAGGIEDLKDVVVTLHWGSALGTDNHKGAELFQGSENPKVVPLIKEGETSEVSWEMHCNAPGDVYFWIEFKPGNTDLYIANSANWDDGSEKDNSVKVIQDPETTLEVTIVSPLPGCLAYYNGEEFPITAKVTNTGSKTAKSVDVELKFDEDYFAIVEEPPVTHWDTLASGEETPLLTWTLKVLKGDAPPTPQTITVKATADNANESDASIEVTPIPRVLLKLDVTPLSDNKVIVGSDFDYKVRVTNLGWADAYEVYAVIFSLSDNIMLQPGFNDLRVYLGTLQGHGGSQNSKEATFKLQCESAGKSWIIAFAVGKDEYGYSWWCSGEGPQFNTNPGTEIVSDYVNYVFEQVLPGGPILSITSPLDGFATNSSDVTVEFSVVGGTPPYKYEAMVDGPPLWPAYSEIPGSPFTFHNLPDGPHTIYIKVIDANDLSYISFVNVTIDKTPPPAPVANPVGGTYQGEQNVVLLDAEDGVTFYYALDEPDLPLASFHLYTTPITISEGLHLLRAYAVDAAGNKSSVMIQSYQIVPATITFDIDLTAGWNFISVPFTTSTSAFTNCSLFIGQSGSVATLEPGEGYFVLNNGDAETVTISGLPNASGFEIAATGNWQFIGNPFEVPVLWSSVTGAHITLAFYLDTATGTWQMVDLSTGSMQPGVGYIILTSDIGDLVFQRP